MDTPDMDVPDTKNASPHFRRESLSAYSCHSLRKLTIFGEKAFHFVNVIASRPTKTTITNIAGDFPFEVFFRRFECLLRISIDLWLSKMFFAIFSQKRNDFIVYFAFYFK